MAGYDDRSYPTANDDYAMGVPVTLASDGRPNYVPLAEPVVVSGEPLVDSVPMGVAVGVGGGHYARGGTRRQTRKTCWGRVAQIIARETKTQSDVVGRRPWSATSLFERRWLTDDDKGVLKKLAETEQQAEEPAEELVAK